MIIDSHVHLKHGDSAKTEYGARDIVETMDAAGIDKSVVFAMSTTARRAIEMAGEAAGEYPDRLIPYAYALPHPGRAVIEEIDRAIQQHGFRGIKIHGGECTLEAYMTDPVLDLAARRKVPCLIDFCGRPAHVVRMARDFPDTRIIVAHLGRYLCTDSAALEPFLKAAEAHANVYLDVSGVVLTWRIADAVRRVGSARVLFGTDGPHPAPNLAEKARNDIQQVRMAGLSPEDEQAVLGGSIARLLGM